MKNEFKKTLENLEKERINKKSYPSEGRGYFYMHKGRYIKNYNVIKNILKKDEQILDLGSVPCHFIACLQRMQYNVVGIDKDPSRDKKFISQESLKIHKCDIEENKLPFKDNSFDVIIFSEIIEHLYVNPIFTLKEIKRILKKDGKLILTSPNGYSLKRVVKFLFGKGLGEDPFQQFNKLFLQGHRGPVREYSLKELKSFLTNVGFKVEKTFFLFYNHYKLRNNPLAQSFLNLIYFILPFFRTHIIIIAKK